LESKILVFASRNYFEVVVSFSRLWKELFSSWSCLFQTVQEVGEAMMTSLKVDKNGACYAVMPDSPLIEFPNYRTNYGYLVKKVLYASGRFENLILTVYVKHYAVILMPKL
jgi:hypothetical protein